MTKELEQTWHARLSLKPPESLTVACDAPVEREKRPRDDSDPWRVGWCPDEHRRLEIFGGSRVVISWVNGAWEVKGHKHAEVVMGVVDQFVRWYIGGVFWPRTDKADWCKRIFREHNTVADMHANWLMDNGDSGAKAQWETPDLFENLQKARQDVGESEPWCSRVLRVNSAMVAEREALRMGIGRLAVLMPTKVSLFDFEIENLGRTVQYKRDAQFLRLFGQHRCM